MSDAAAGKPPRLFQVDAFTHRPFAGNPAAVCLLDRSREDSWMQAMAAEMNLSETAFVRPTGESFELRWFTPTTEVDLCGHATLASAHVLWQEEILRPAETARFDTRSGRLTAWRRGEWIAMDFPAAPVAACPEPDGLGEALGLEPRFTGRGGADLLVEAADEAAVRAARPDAPALARLSRRGVILTARAEGNRFDFVSRFFAPAVGVDEDPVTGSAHCTLGPFWGERLGKSSLLGCQLSARGGVVRVELRGERVELQGQAVTVLAGPLAPGAAP